MLSGEKLPMERGRVLRRPHYLSNCNTALEFLKSKRVRPFREPQMFSLRCKVRTREFRTFLKIKKQGGFFYFFSMHCIYHCFGICRPSDFGGCWDRTQDCCDFGIWQLDALTIRLDLILFFTRFCSVFQVRIGLSSALRSGP